MPVAAAQAATWATLARVVGLVTRVDRAGLEAVAALRSGGLTPVMILASAWWVKGLVFVAAGAVADLVWRPRRVPTTALLAAGAFAVASLTTSAIKALADRPRPPVGDPGFTALIDLPGDASFPSGHASTAFAAAGVVAIRYPVLRVPLLGLAAVIALSRVYLGVHYPLDVIGGAALGLSIAWATVALARRAGALA